MLKDLLLIGIALGASVGVLIAFVNEMMKKDNQIVELQRALVDAYTEIELAKLGVLK